MHCANRSFALRVNMDMFACELVARSALKWKHVSSCHVQTLRMIDIDARRAARERKKDTPSLC
jgi:hypothetical protein